MSAPTMQLTEVGAKRRREAALEVAMPTASTVAIVLYNVLGQPVRVLWRGQMEAGNHPLCWDGRDDHGVECPSGLYYVGCQAGNVTIMCRIHLSN